MLLVAACASHCMWRLALLQAQAARHSDVADGSTWGRASHVIACGICVVRLLPMARSFGCLAASNGYVLAHMGSWSLVHLPDHPLPSIATTVAVIKDTALCPTQHTGGI
jgi:hypothetical protein